MKKNEDDILYLRQEITRLKNKLSKLDQEVDPTSLTCGHDVALANIRKLVEQYKIRGLSQLVCFDTHEGWYTTNLQTALIDESLQDFSTVEDYFLLLSRKGTWHTLSKAFYGKKLDLDSEEAQNLLARDLLTPEGKLSWRGLQTYISGGHICFNSTLKLDPEKTCKILDIIFQNSGFYYMDKVSKSFEEFQALIRNDNLGPLFQNESISETDLKIFFEQCK